MSNACSLSFSMHGKNTLSEHNVLWLIEILTATLKL